MKFRISKKWCMASAKKEGDACVGAGLPSVLGLSKIKAPAKRVGTGEFVRVRLSSAEALLAEWESDARLYADAGKEKIMDAEDDAYSLLGKSSQLDDCIADLRRLLGLPKKRQPHPNT